MAKKKASRAKRQTMDPIERDLWKASGEIVKAISSPGSRALLRVEWFKILKKNLRG